MQEDQQAQALTGPRTGVEEFFNEHLNLNHPGLEEVRAAVEGGDYPGAQTALARYLRSHLDPDRFFTIPYEYPENAFTRPGESETEAAGRICQNKMISCGVEYDFEETVDWFYNPTYNQYKEWTWQLSRHNEWKLLAHAYRETGDERYAACCARQFRSWVHQAVCPGEVPGHETLCWRTIECGIRMGANWPTVLHAFLHSPSFTDELLVEWMRSVYEHGRRLHDHHMHGNWLVMEMNGLAQIGILFPELRDAKDWLAFAFQFLEEELGRQIYPDGFQYELSTGYHDVVINNYQRLIGVARAYGVPLPESFLPVLENMASIDVKLMMPNGRLPDINDGKWSSAAALLAPKRELFPDRQDFLWVVSGGKEGRPPQDYTSVALPWAGMLVMRTGWGPDDLWAFFEAAPFGRAHQHEDRLNLLIYGGGRMLLTEGGNYAYDDSEMRRYVLSTFAHNTALVDGQGQNRRRDYAWNEGDIGKKSGLHWRIGEESDYGEGVYDEGYGPDAARSASHQRSVIFYKKPPQGLPPLIVVSDRFTAQSQRHFSLLWHLGGESARLSGARCESEGVCLLSSRPDAGTKLVSGCDFPQWQGWRATASVQGSYVPVPTLIQTVSGERARMVTVIVPGEGACPIESVEASAQPEDTAVTLHLRGGGALTLDERDFR